MIPHYPASEDAYEKASSILQDEALEEECKRRGVRIAFLTFAAISGFDSVKLIKELHHIVTAPVMDSEGNAQELDEPHFLRMTFWSVEAENDVTLFSPSEQATIERSAMEMPV